MVDINQGVFKAIEEKGTIRIVADVPTSTLDTNNILDAASNFVRPLINEWEKNNSTKLLVVDIYPRRTFIVIDINNHRYDCSIAHLQTFPIPVYILRYSNRHENWIFFRRPVEDQKIAIQLAGLHNCNGTNPTPFLADHINGSVYLSPRTPFATRQRVCLCGRSANSVTSVGES
ncbi:hypothetical protein BDV25DRAFT_102950 [Aspergillus avenaceus]|uniref:Uncharacterized protein n=1 Tax=Aspergillus avenaceus TaxID=36643 RepID=A0A5N6U7J5_ASPAV|nr:hypothetical protein BDV25DRAFT_102950 [Aspergillus avenaceus]